MTIGNRIHDLRKVEDLTQEEFARKIGIKRAHIANLEKDRANSSEQLLLSISRTFGVGLEWLKHGTGEMRASVAAESGEVYLIARELVAEPRLKKMMEALERIYKGGNPKKLGVIEGILEQLDPGEKGKQVEKKLA